MIKICKILKKIYNKEDYYIFSGWCGESITLVYVGDEPPEPLKTVDYQINGEMVKHKKYGKQLIISDYKKVGKILIAKQTETERVRGQSMDEWWAEYDNS